MQRHIILFIVLLLACGAAFAEEAVDGAEAIPGEMEEFALETPEAAPEATPQPTLKATPLPTLEPGSINYPAEKVNFEGEIWTILTRRWGLEDYQAAGLMSNLFAESSFCPYNVQNRDGVDNRRGYRFRAGDGVGFGLAQWTSSGRKAALQRYAVECGDANLVWDFDIQMAYMQREIDMKALKATQTLYDATEWAVMRYERPNQKYENSWPGRRYDIALQIFRNHTGSDYEQPELSFEAVTADGADAVEGFTLFEDGGLTVSSNYYWRLEKPAWLDVTCPDFYDPEAWVDCECGYAGATQLRLSAIIPPLFAGDELRFLIFRDGWETVRVPVTYAGEDFTTWLSEQIALFLTP